jgi:hypothetical protein
MTVTNRTSAAANVSNIQAQPIYTGPMNLIPFPLKPRQTSIRLHHHSLLPPHPRRECSPSRPRPASPYPFPFVLLLSYPLHEPASAGESALPTSASVFAVVSSLLASQMRARRPARVSSSTSTRCPMSETATSPWTYRSLVGYLPRSQSTTVSTLCGGPPMRPSPARLASAVA